MPKGETWYQRVSILMGLFATKSGSVSVDQARVLLCVRGEVEVLARVNVDDCLPRIGVAASVALLEKLKMSGWCPRRV